MDIRRLVILLLNVAGCMLLTASGWMVFNVVNPLTPPVPDDVTVLDDNSAPARPWTPPPSILRSSFEPLPAPPVLPESKQSAPPQSLPPTVVPDNSARLSQLRLTSAMLAQLRAQPFPPASRQLPERIVMPTIAVDSPVQPVGWKVEQIDGHPYSEWLVADFAVGWHKTSALPGADGNTVMAGHNNINGEVFKNLINVKIGDEIFVFADNHVYRYAVEQKLLVKEAGASLEQRIQNAQWIRPSDDDRLTLVSCWPYTSNTHRVIVVAKPAS